MIKELSILCLIFVIYIFPIDVYARTTRCESFSTKKYLVLNLTHSWKTDTQDSTSVLDQYFFQKLGKISSSEFNYKVSSSTVDGTDIKTTVIISKICRDITFNLPVQFEIKVTHSDNQLPETILVKSVASCRGFIKSKNHSNGVCETGSIFIPEANNTVTVNGSFETYP